MDDGELTHHHSTTKRTIAKLAKREIKKNILTNYGTQARLPTLKEDLRAIPTNIYKFFRFLHIYFWLFFANVLFIPKYRIEWGKYRHWKSSLHGKKLCRMDNQVEVDEIHEPIRKRKDKNIEDQDRINHCGCRRVYFNVSGTMFCTQMRTIRQYPETLLGNRSKRLRYWDPFKEQYFLDRCPRSFESILHFYQSGGKTLSVPEDVPLNCFHAELLFYELPTKVIRRLLQVEGVYDEDSEIIIESSLLKRKILLLLEHADSSSQARLFSYINILVIVVSTVIVCLDSMNQFHVKFSNRSEKQVQAIDIRDPIFLSETFCITFFIMEYLGRLWASPNRREFATKFMNLIDLLAIFPYCLQIGFLLAESYGETGPHKVKYLKIEEGTIWEYIYYFALVSRSFRVLKLSRFSKGLRILGHTIIHSLHEFSLLCFFLFIGVIIFSAALYYAEIEGNPEFSSIPATFFWTISTMTTLGSVQIAPMTVFGKIIASICAICGVLVLSLPVPVIVANFNYFYIRSVKFGKKMTVNTTYTQFCPFLPTCHKDDADIDERDIRLPEEALLDKEQEGDKAKPEKRLSQHSIIKRSYSTNSLNFMPRFKK